MTARPICLARAFKADIVTFGPKLNSDMFSDLKYEAGGGGSNLV
jgi:hypothetical protein